MAMAVLIALALGTGSMGAVSSEIALFAGDGAAVAYIADDLTVYLWSGEPVAYLEDQSGDGAFNVFGFNGKHLGWYDSGVVRDHQGRAVGARKEAFASSVQSEPFKAFKQFKPFKAFKEFAPLRPLFSKEWSRVYLDEFLKQGKS
jgi:hypothetical protein